jgi:hypothetical protein
MGLDCCTGIIYLFTGSCNRPGPEVHMAERRLHGGARAVVPCTVDVITKHAAL